MSAGQRPHLLLGIDGMAGQHLMLRVACRVQREQRVVDHHGVGASSERTDQRIKQREVGIGHQLQGGRRGRSHNRRAGGVTCQGSSGGTSDKLASSHSMGSDRSM